ncbi:MAG: glycosyltransferase family 2 protein [Chitinophagales bacterium]
MSFSILIPVYNYDIRALVEQLYEQAFLLSKEFEIVLIDDCSDLSNAYLNRKIVEFPEVSFHLLSKNVGRSKIRNLLFEKAKYEQCIIMDCDVMVQDKNFLKTYFEHLTSENVVVGGHKYEAIPPENKQKQLHWNYGVNKEMQPFTIREKSSYASFMTNCFAIYKSTFEQIKFDERIAEYGHEDTLFGIALEKENIGITHIDNPVLHKGLDDKSVFIEKQQKAIANLKNLETDIQLKDDLRRKIKLLKANSNPLYRWIAKWGRRWAENELKKENPSLYALQIMKLNWYNS